MKKINILLIFTLILLLFSISSVCASDVNDTATITIDNTGQIIEETNTELENQNDILNSADEDTVSMDPDSWFYNDVIWYDGDYEQTDHVFIIFADDLQNPENITVQLFHDANSHLINDDENPEEYTVEYYDCKNPISNVDLAIINNQNFEITKLTTNSNGIATYKIPFNVDEFSFFVGFWYDEYHVANYVNVGKTTYNSCNWGTWNGNKTNGAGENNDVSSNSKSYDVSSFEELVSALSSHHYSDVIINLKEDIILNTFYDLSPAIKILTINGNGKTINGFSEYKHQFLEIKHDVDVTIQNIRIINCEASYGAVIYNSGNGKLTVVNSVFENNNVLRYGGVIYNTGDNSIIRNCTFKNNFASKGLDSTGITILGGAIYNDAENVIITDSLFENNAVKTSAWGVDDRTIEGGAIYSMGDNVRITGNIFKKNSADNGAAIYTYGDNILIDSNTFKSNNAVSSSRDEAIIYMYRGGFYNEIDESKNIFVTDTECYSTIFHYAYGGSAVITNNVFDDRLNTIIETSPENTFTENNKNNYLVITLMDENRWLLDDFSLYVDFNGVKHLKTDDYGQIKLSVDGMAPKVYTAIITYAGNDKYVGSTATVNITVLKSPATTNPVKSTPVKKQTAKIIAKNNNYKAKTKVKKYTVTLKSKAGKAIKNVKITIKINKKIFTSKTNAKGKATFKISKLTKKGTHKAVITFKGNKNYKKVSKTVKIKVK